MATRLGCHKDGPTVHRPQGHAGRSLVLLSNFLLWAGLSLRACGHRGWLVARDKIHTTCTVLVCIIRARGLG